MPDLSVVICLRNPLEVALSLRKRAMSSLAFGLNLWTTYNRSLLDVLPKDRYIVTHYESFFYRPQKETRRILDALGLHASDQLIAQARTSTIKGALRRHTITDEELRETANRVLTPEAATELLELHSRLLREAEWDSAPRRMSRV